MRDAIDNLVVVGYLPVPTIEIPTATKVVILTIIKAWWRISSVLTKQKRERKTNPGRMLHHALDLHGPRMHWQAKRHRPNRRRRALNPEKEKCQCSHVFRHRARAHLRPLRVLYHGCFAHYVVVAVWLVMLAATGTLKVVGAVEYHRILRRNRALMYQAVPEAVAASPAGANLDSLDSRNYQQGLHRAAVGTVAVAENCATADLDC